MAKARQKRAKSGRKEGVLRELNTNKTLYLMCLPALLLLFLLCYLPFGGIWMAFTDFNALDGVFGSPFVGLRNFSIFFKQLTAWNVVKNTLIINFFGIILGLIVPISLAIFLNEMRLGIYKRVVQSVMFFPYFLSWVVVGAIVYGLLATDVGVVNNVLKSMDMEPVRWFAEPKYWKTILIEYAQAHGLGEVSYEVEGEGPDHQRVFTAQAFVSERLDALGSGQASSKKRAENAAAQDAMSRLSPGQ